MDYGLAILVKRAFLEISRRASFRKLPVHAMLPIMLLWKKNVRDRVFDRVTVCRDFACYFKKKWFHHRRSHINFKSSRNTQKETFAMESIFCIIVGDILESSNRLHRTLPQTFFWVSSEFFKREFRTIKGNIFRGVKNFFEVGNSGM